MRVLELLPPEVLGKAALALAAFTRWRPSNQTKAQGPRPTKVQVQREAATKFHL